MMTEWISRIRLRFQVLSNCT